MARVILHARNLPQRFWAEAVHTTCYTINRVYFRPGMKKTSYEIWKGKRLNIQYFDIFGARCFILNDREPRWKFEPKSDEGIFLGYSPNSHAYRVYNKRSRNIMEYVNVVVDDRGESTKFWSHTGNDADIPSEDMSTSSQPETQPKVGPEPGADNPLDDPKADLTNDIHIDGNDLQQDSNSGNRSSHLQKDHHVDDIIGDVSVGIQTGNIPRRGF